MRNAPLGTLIPILLLVGIVGTAGWVYTDANERRRRGYPVAISIGSLQVDTPEKWFVACVLVWVVFFPLYLTARTSTL